MIRCDVVGHQLFDCFKDHTEVFIVFFLHGFDFLGEEFVRVHQSAELDKGAHDGDVDFDGARGTQDAGEHGDTLFGEDVGPVFSVLAPL